MRAAVASQHGVSTQWPEWQDLRSSQRAINVFDIFTQGFDLPCTRRLLCRKRRIADLKTAWKGASRRGIDCEVGCCQQGGIYTHNGRACIQRAAGGGLNRLGNFCPFGLPHRHWFPEQYGRFAASPTGAHCEMRAASVQSEPEPCASGSLLAAAISNAAINSTKA
jgi:hypothetical protein